MCNKKHPYDAIPCFLVGPYCKHSLQTLRCFFVLFFKKQASKATYVPQKAAKFNTTSQEFTDTWAKKEDKAGLWSPHLTLQDESAGILWFCCHFLPSYTQSPQKCPGMSTHKLQLSVCPPDEALIHVSLNVFLSLQVTNFPFSPVFLLFLHTILPSLRKWKIL